MNVISNYQVHKKQRGMGKVAVFVIYFKQINFLGFQVKTLQISKDETISLCN